MTGVHATAQGRVEWTHLLACPRCQEPLAGALPENRCARCGERFAREGNVVRWGERVTMAPLRRRGVRDYIRSATYRLDPLASPYSPLATLTARRTEHYYA